MAIRRPRFAGRERREEHGFTLIELMVVMLIIAILIAIGVPTFLGARQRAQDRAIQASLRHALTAERAYQADTQTYADASVGAFTSSEPSLTFVGADPPVVTDGRTITVVLSGTAVILLAKSASGTCFYLKDDLTSTPGTLFTRNAASPCATSNAVGGWHSGSSAW
ncbi:MAG: hypothetical protein NVSMB57_03680 [Actinomycetota bacterium]